MSDLLTPEADHAAQRAHTREAAVECRSLVRIYRTGNLEVQALQGLELRIDRGEFVAIVGASGSGKSTLLGILSGLDAPSAGSVRVDGRELATLGAKERLDYRRRAIGFVWQSPPRNLIPHLTAAENVALPQRFLGTRRSARRARALELLDSMGALSCRDRVPGQLSGGEQQRVAIAVALANNPALLLADEPTGELDSDTAQQVFAALREANDVHGVTTLVVTHDEAVAGQVRRTIAIRDGRTSTETFRPGAEAGAGRGSGPVFESDEEVEYVVVDRSGRLQLPHDLVEHYEIRDRVRLTREPGHVGVWPDREAGGDAQ
ncbi:ABC transporter ATP-binding protein [Actinospica durhamensis]|uniref:ABC transporter ATP-binding protein n=1 Tax=Actinospica durhamensis TaxID=1508375 RepID=A0A941IS87_9ACTN|nr:ABC transporter ATP-binding protein [Actinospica durhamensis]MBR7836112.1 ABC transporter ATP-binding protein [Actinospica durhamensis]